MSEHLSEIIFAALADGELPPEQAAYALAHLAECPACTSAALSKSMLKAATARAGHRFAPSDAFENRIAAMVRQRAHWSRGTDDGESSARAWPSLVRAAAVVLLAAGLAGAALWTGHRSRSDVVSAQRAALETELLDQHIAALAASATPQVLSSDRHTVKPWFQGKLPFSFNLPENLPADTRLEGADLTYIQDRPAAQLIYTVGLHRVSFFLWQRSETNPAPEAPADRAGFHIAPFNTRDIDAVAIGDVDPSRLSGVVTLFVQAQSSTAPPE